MESPGMTPRAYQIHLEKCALEQNTIIYLPTGSGKTFIAVQIIKRLQQTIIPTFSNGGKRTFYLVNTVTLVEQQTEVLTNLTSLKINGYSSEDKTDLWCHGDWLEQLEHTQVLVMTSQILLDLLLHNYISLSQINLMIFDECHHAVSSHPMRLIMKRFENVPADKKPRILGLTATLLNRNINPSQVEYEIRELEKSFQSKVCTTNSWDEVLSFSTNPHEVVAPYGEYIIKSSFIEEAMNVLFMAQKVALALRLPQDVSKCSAPVGTTRMAKDALKFNKLLKNTIESVIGHIGQFGAFGGSLSILAKIILLERLKLTATTPEKKEILQCILFYTLKARLIVEKAMKKHKGYDRIHDFSSPKILKLLEILQEYSPECKSRAKKYNLCSEKLASIIFVKERFTAKVLSCILKYAKETNPMFNYLNVDFAVGYQLNPFSDTREGLYEKKQNKRTIGQFVLGNLNCIVSTEVMEEGVDIPRCTLIVRFDDILNFRSYIQAKGRGRHKNSSYVMMVMRKDVQAFDGRHFTYLQIEDIMKDTLIGKTEERDVPDDDEVSLMYEHLCPPYRVDDAVVTMNSAISLVNRYCATLYQDKFTSFHPEWFIKTVNKTVKISIMLPVVCPLKNAIHGVPMGNIKDAKRAAALEACKQLHIAGELNDQLLPFDKMNEPFDESIEIELFSHWLKEDSEDPEQEGKNLPKPGSKGRKRKYARKFPKLLDGVLEMAGSYPITYYMHSIQLKPLKEANDDQTSVIYDLLESADGFAIITQKKIPDICSFTLFMSSGEVEVKIKTNITVVKLSEDECRKIRQFHFMLFNDVLGIQKMFAIYDLTFSNYHFFVVPVRGEGNIHWPFILKHTSVEEIEEPSIVNRRELKVDPEEYLGCIVAPWYRSQVLDTRYIVTEVCQNMNPLSPFSDQSFASFAEYFKSKYDLNIHGPKSQPLLKVRYLSGKMNSLLPRQISLQRDGMSKRKMMKVMGGHLEDISQYDELLVPEFCIKFNFPGVLWLKATILPSVIHRVTMLLQAEELRSFIAKETGLGCVDLPADCNWNHLSGNIHSVKNAQESIFKESFKEKTPYPADEIVNTSGSDVPIQPTLAAPRINSFQLTSDKIDSKYPWSADMEPIDIDRNFHTVTLADVECYEDFIQQKVISCPGKQPSTSKINQPTISKRAICAPPYKYIDTIEILKKTPNKLGPHQGEILEALTTSRCNDIINMERLETLGDSFLKIAASFYVYHNFESYSEGRLTSLKGKIVSNRNLYYCGVLIDLPGRMKIKQFSPRSEWITPAFCIPKPIKKLLLEIDACPSVLYGVEATRQEILSAKINSTTLQLIEEKLFEWAGDSDAKMDSGMETFLGMQNTQDKVVADCVEALIGVYLLNAGMDAAFRLLQWLKVLPPKYDILGLLTKKVPTPISLGKATLKEIDFHLDYSLQKIEDVLGYKFKDPSYLLQALSHSSNSRNRITDSYERLEFLGDAILDFLITCHIYENCGQLNPGELTDLRSALVNNITFGCFTVRLGLHKFLQSSNILLDSAILKFVLHQIEREHVIDEAVLYLLEEDACSLAEYIEVPKALGDIFESLAGAIFLDSGNNLPLVWKIFYKIMHNEIAEFTTNVPKPAVRRLYENIHAAAVFHKSVTLENGTVMIPLQLRVHGQPAIVHGFGRNKSSAKKSAAQIALRMQGLAPA